MRRGFWSVAVSVALGGCAAVGPDYERPPVEIPVDWQVSVQQANDLANTRWWEQFQDPVLNALIQTALLENRDVRRAAARVEEYLGRYGAAQSVQFPKIDIGAESTRIRNNEAGVKETEGLINSHRLNLGASFELDLWGKLRRAAEAARAELLAMEENRRTVILTLVSQLARAYVQLLDYDKRLAITRATLQTRQESVRINRLRFQAGLIGEMDYQQAVAEYQSAAVQIPLLEKQIVQQENAISLLLGRNPSRIERGTTLDGFMLLEIPKVLPSDLLERRPDIRQAEQQLIAANAQIGVAKAAFFPQISLSALLGTASGHWSDLFGGSSQTWKLAGSLSQPVFTGGQLTSRLRAAEAVQQQAVLYYQQTVQNAFTEVNDALIEFTKLREQLKDQDSQIKALQRYLDLAKLRYQNGYSDYLTVVDAERNLYAAQLQYAQNQGNLFSALVNLYKVLGGGWVRAAEELITQQRDIPAS